MAVALTMATAQASTEGLECAPPPTKPERARTSNLLECVAVNVTAVRPRVRAIRELGADLL